MPNEEAQPTDRNRRVQMGLPCGTDPLAPMRRSADKISGPVGDLARMFVAATDARLMRHERMDEATSPTDLPPSSHSMTLEQRDPRD